MTFVGGIPGEDGMIKMSQGPAIMFGQTGQQFRYSGGKDQQIFSNNGSE